MNPKLKKAVCMAFGIAEDSTDEQIEMAALNWGTRVPPKQMSNGINTEALVMYEDQGWRWMDHDGSVLSRVANTAAYEASLYTSQELACVRRNAHFVISDLVESSI